MGKMAEMTAQTELAEAKPQDGVQTLLSKNWSRIEAVAPKHLSKERLYQLSVSAINTTPNLAQCSPASLLSCVMKCSALGLEPSAVDGMGMAYILPYKNYNKVTKRSEYQATFILGYKGMLNLARRSGDIKSISARAVYEGDLFEYNYGLNEDIKHVPTAKEKSDKTLTHVYMVVHFLGGGHYMDVMNKEEVEAIRARSKAKDNGPWKTDYEAMAKKTVIRRAFPYLPVSLEAQTAAAADETDGGFVPQISIEPVIEAEPAEAPPLPEPEPQASAESAKVEGSAENKSAKCQSCGKEAGRVAADADLEDLNREMVCCENPNYGWN